MLHGNKSAPGGGCWGVMLAAIIFVAIVFLAYANGSNDNFKATATLFGSGTLSYRAALILATAAQLAGSVAALLLASTLLQAFSGKGLVPLETVADARFIASVALAAAGAVLIATRLGIPISTTHALVGGLVGSGLALASDQLAWAALGATFMLPLLISPLLAFLAAAIVYPCARFTRRRLGIEAETCLCVGQCVEPVAVVENGALVVQRTGIALTIDEQSQCEQRYTGRVVGVAARPLVDAVHTFSAFSLGFARSLNDTPKILALLIAAGAAGIEPRVGLAVIAIVMALGGIIHSRRLARTLGERITTMNRGQGLVANLVASALVIGATLIGKPVSTTHVATGAIFGIGAWTGSARWNVVTGIVMAWIATLPLAAGLAWIFARSLGML